MDRSISLMKEVWVPALKPFAYKEAVDPTTGEKSHILRGLILPFDKVSRNNVLYNADSIRKKHKDLIGRPVMYNHKIEGNELPIGHFTNSYTINEPDDRHPVAGWYYEADIDPHERDVIRKLDRGDLRHVSIQLVGGEVYERTGGEGSYTEAIVSDIIEGSLVPAPGFLDTTAEFAEAFKKFKEKMFEIGEIVWYKGKKWQVADHLNGKYLLWSSDAGHKKEIKDWIPENQLSKIESSNVDTQYQEPRYDGDCQICPFDKDEEVEIEKMAERYINELGEDAVKALIKEHYK